MEKKNLFFKPAQQIELAHSKATWSSGMAMEGADLETTHVRPAEQVPSAHTETPTAKQHPTNSATQSHVHRRQYCHLWTVSQWLRAHLGGWALLPGLGIFPPADPTHCEVPEPGGFKQSLGWGCFVPSCWSQARIHRGIQNSQSHKEKALEGKYDSMRKRLPGVGAEPYTLVPSPGIAHAYCTED